MSSLSIGLGSIFRTSMTAMLDAIGSTIPKAAVATLEDKTKSPQALARQCILDEMPETFWKAFTGSILVKIAKIVTPNVPEQIVIMPGELIGSFMHWLTATHQSLNKTAISATNFVGTKFTFAKSFFNNFIRKPMDLGMHFLGIDKSGTEMNFLKFGLSNLGLFTLGTLALRGAEDENIPGINMDHNDPPLTSALKTIGYTAVEQGTHLFSQIMRYYIDYKDEFGKKNTLAKAVANAINEKTIPGNILSALGGCFSTLWLGRYIPKSAAAALGEALPKGFTRLVEFRQRRSTKEAIDEKGRRVANYRYQDVPWFNKMLDGFDYVFKPVRMWLINNVVAKIFKPENTKLEDFRKELVSSFDRREDLLIKAIVKPNNDQDSLAVRQDIRAIPQKPKTVAVVTT